MKAISVRQPWAEFIMQGKKTVEVRKFNTSYRGPLLIHAASIRGLAEFKKANIGIELANSFQGQVFIGIVELLDILVLTNELWLKLAKQHLIPGIWSPKEHKFAWILDNPRRIKPIHYKGLPKIFLVNEKIISSVEIEYNS